MPGNARIAAANFQHHHRARGALCVSSAATHRVMKNVRATVYNHYVREFKQIVAAREEFFKANLPTSTMVEVNHLSEPGLLVEIQAIAAI